MNRKFPIIVLIAALVTGLLITAPLQVAKAAVPAIQINITNANQGATFDVPVLIDTLGTGIRAYQFSLTFDASRIQVNSIGDGGFLTSAGAGACITPVQPAIDNTAGTVTAMSCALLGGSGLVANGTGTLAKINLTVKPGAPNGKALWGMSAIQVRDVNASLITGVTSSVKWVMVGPAPNLTLALSFSPIGSGQSFNTLVTVTNSGGSIADPDTLHVTLSNTAPPVAQDFAVPALDVNASQTFSILGANLSAGAQSSTATAALLSFGTIKQGIYSSTTDTRQISIDASFGAYLKIFPDVQITLPNLIPGFNSAPGIVNIRSNTNWEVDVFDNNPNTAWHLTEFNGNQYKTLRLSQPLHVVSAQYDVTEGTPSILANGTPLTQLGDRGIDIPISLTQYLLYADPLLPGGETYHLVLVFFVYVTI